MLGMCAYDAVAEAEALEEVQNAVERGARQHVDRRPAPGTAK